MRARFRALKKHHGSSTTFTTMVTDPISDMLIQLKNAARAGKAGVLVPFSNLKLEIANILEKNGYVTAVAKRGKKNRKFIYCEVVFNGGKAKLNEIKRLSKPSRRIYQGVKDIHPVRQGQGLLVLSTPKGVLTDSEARSAGVGGEALFLVW